MKKTQYIILMATLVLAPTLGFAAGSVTTTYKSSNSSQYLCQSDSLYPAYGIVISPGMINETPYSLISSWGSGEHTLTYYLFTATTKPDACGPVGTDNKTLGKITLTIAADNQTANVINTSSVSSMTFTPSTPTNDVSRIKVNYSDTTGNKK